MINLVEKACRESVIHHLPGIKTCEVVSDNDPKKNGVSLALFLYFFFMNIVILLVDNRLMWSIQATIER